MRVFQSGKTLLFVFFTGAFLAPLGLLSGIPIIPFVKTPPPMEGKFDASSWQPCLRLEMRTRDGKAPARSPGTILLRHDANILYAAAIMKGEDIRKLIRRRDKDSRKPVYQVSRIEFFMGEANSFQFIVDWMERTYKSSNTPLFTKINYKKDAYIVRVGIPLDVIPRSRISQDVVKMNFYRQSDSGISSWKPNTGTFRDLTKLSPVLLAPPEKLVSHLAGKNQKDVASLLAAGSLTEKDASFLRSLIQEKTASALAKKGGINGFLKALGSFDQIATEISRRQEKNLFAKFGVRPSSLHLTSGPETTIPKLWVPAKLMGKDFWYAFTMLAGYSMGPMEKAGMMELPLYKEAAFHLRGFQGTDEFLTPGKPIYQYLEKYPDNPIFFGCDTYRLVKGERYETVNKYFTKSFMEAFYKKYGKRLISFTSPESFLNSYHLFLRVIDFWKFKNPRNRKEAYEVMRSLYNAVVDAPPELPSFRNVALNSKYARKYAGHNSTASNFNHMMYSLGDRISGNEFGECMGPTPVKYAFARGAARQYGKIWENYQTYYSAANYKKADGFLQCAATSSLSAGLVQKQLTPECRVKSYCYLNGLRLGTALERQKSQILHPFLGGVGLWRSEADLNELVCFYDTETIGSVDPLAINLRDQKVHISPMAKLNIHFYDNIVKKRDRGVMLTPVALVYDRYHGCFPLYLGQQVWGFFPPTEMEKVMWAIDEHIYKRVKDNSTYCTSAFGDIFDVITNDSKLDFLKTYKVLYLTGDVTLDKKFAGRLAAYVKAGGTLVINAELLRKYNAFGEDFTGCTLTGETGQSHSTYSLLSGKVIPENIPYTYRVVKPGARTRILAVTADAKQKPAILLNPWGKGRVIVTTPFHMKEEKSLEKMLSLFDHLMENFRRETIPIKVDTPMQYSINRNKGGWIVYLQNNSGLPANRGIIKDLKDTLCDVTKVEKALITIPGSLGKVKKVIDWWCSRELPFKMVKGDAVLEVTLPGGDACALEFVTK